MRIYFYARKLLGIFRSSKKVDICVLFFFFLLPPVLLGKFQNHRELEMSTMTVHIYLYLTERHQLLTFYSFVLLPSS